MAASWRHREGHPTTISMVSHGANAIFQARLDVSRIPVLKRRLIFEGQMVRWECSRSAWSEDIVHSDGLESKFRCNWIDAVTYMYPSLDVFGSLGTCSSSTTIDNSRMKKIFCRHLLVSFPCSVKNTKVDSSAAYQRCISKAA